MTASVLGALLGLLFIVPTILFSRSRGWDAALFALTLASLPGFYMLFGLLASQEGVVRLELLWGLPFLVLGLMAWVTRSRFPRALLGVLWTLHAGYDLFHDRLFVNDGVWAFYPVFCAVVDGVVGLYLIAGPSAFGGSSGTDE